MTPVNRLGALACAALILAACSIGEPLPEATTYVVEPQMPPAAPAGARKPEALRVGNVRVAAAFSGNSLVFRASDVRYVSDPYHAFIADPASMLGDRMADWLEQAGPFASVVPPDGVRSTRYVLQASVTELYGDFRPGRQPAAVMTVQFALLDTDSPRAKTVLARTLSRRIDLPEASFDALVRGYGAALAEILAELVAAMR
jgi:cholesterol transport system auxiliary component